mgnify:CR=1 FL=1
MLIGIDAGDWLTIDPLVQKGVLPSFARLKTSGRTGVMRRNGRRDLCHVIDPAEVRLSASEDGKALTVEFPGGATFHRQVAEEPKNATLLAEALYEVTGRHLALEFALGEHTVVDDEPDEPPGEERILELMRETLDARDREE